MAGEIFVLNLDERVFWAERQELRERWLLSVLAETGNPMDDLVGIRCKEAKFFPHKAPEIVVFDETLLFLAWLYKQRFFREKTPGYDLIKDDPRLEQIQLTRGQVPVVAEVE